MSTEDKQGFIQLIRNSFTNIPWYTSEKFTKSQAILHLLIFANSKETEIEIDGVKINLKRGQLARSKLTLSKEWKWSRNKVTNFLNESKRRGFIDHETFPQKGKKLTTIISILVYDEFVFNKNKEDIKAVEKWNNRQTVYNIESNSRNAEKIDNRFGSNLNTDNKDTYKDNNKYYIYKNKLVKEIIEWLVQVPSHNEDDIEIIENAIKKTSPYKVRSIFERYRSKYPSCKITTPHLDLLSPRLKFLDELSSSGETKYFFN